MSSPRLTVARARELLHEHVDASDPMDEKFLRQLNQVCERFIDSGNWAKSEFIAELSAPNGYITLPRRASALLGVRIDNQPPRRVFAMAHEFSETGPGGHDFDHQMSSLYELPDACVHTDLTEAATISLHLSSNVDAGIGGVATLRGLDADGNRLFTEGVEGISVTLAYPSVNFPVSVSRIDSLTLPLTTGYSTLKAGTTEIGVYEPGETDPSYRRYKVGKVGDTCTVFALCSRRHVELLAETDLVNPSNTGALKHGLIGLRLEDASDLDTALGHFNQAYSLLNAELRRLRGKTRVTPMFNPGVPPVRALY